MLDLNLKLGESARVRPRWWGTTWSVIYAGMLRDGTCSFAVTWSLGHASAAYNVFLAPDIRRFVLPFGTIEVFDPSPERVRIRVEES